VARRSSTHSMAAVVAWGRIVFVGPRGIEILRPDLAVVDAIARSQLRARRLGWCIRLQLVGDDLAALLDLVGLRREVGGEAEGGEEVRVEEGVEPDDPVPRDLEDL